jgi:hypothetical protein
MATKNTKRHKNRSELNVIIRFTSRRYFCAFWCFLWLTNSTAFGQETLAQITARLAKETTAAYDKCRFSALSKDYFSRFSRDPSVKPRDDETAITSKWRILVWKPQDPLVHRMAKDLQTFLRERMDIDLKIETPERAGSDVFRMYNPAILLFDTGIADTSVKDSFAIKVDKQEIWVRADSPGGLRDGVVRLVDMIGFRQAPYLHHQPETTYKPVVPLRLGAVPAGGSYKDAAFFGFNAVLYGGGDLYALSQSNAIPELAVRRVPGRLEEQEKGMKELEKYDLKAYAWLNTRQKFPKDDPVFKAHPEIRGALTWGADGEYTLCTSQPLVRRFLKESIQGLFKSMPELHGVVLIIGGEGFYHCHIRPYGVAKGHTNCPRCEKLGAETAVADLCNDLATAARAVRPDAEIVLWPYSAEHVWAADFAATGFLEKLKPGTSLLTEVEKSETITKLGGIQKSIWDYSIDFIGPATRTKQQIAVCNKHHIPVYLKSEPELGFEAPLLPQIPCMDRWADRAEALATSGAQGAWVFPAFKPFYGATTAEINKLLWWSPQPDRETILHNLARRIAGERAAGHLRNAWRATSDAIRYSPELPSYYLGPYYLGPMHPMCANPAAALPDVFYGQYLFHAEVKDSEGLKKEPTFVTKPQSYAPAYADEYRKMKDSLATAADDIHKGEPLVDDRHRMTFDAEAGPILWLYCTARTHSNFYESCTLHDEILRLAEKPERSSFAKQYATEKLARWRDVLKDELENTRAALPLMKQDMRLDPYYGGDHTFAHGEKMIEAKLKILEKEINEYLPALATKFSK